MAEIQTAARPMNEKELLALIGQYEKAALGSPTAVGPSVSTTITPAGSTMTTLEIDRYNALNAYFARPLGNEVADRSQMVIPELRDTVEWIMPQVMRILCASKPCAFDKTGPDDEKQAALESEVVNQVFMQGNGGFFVLHDMVKDALLLRNGYCDVYWEVRDTIDVVDYSGVDEMQLTQILNPEDPKTKVEVIEQDEQPGPEVTDPQTGQKQPGPPVFDITVRVTKQKGKLCVDAAPPEEMLVSPDNRQISMDESPFVQHKTRRSRTWLIELGYPEDKVAKIAMAHPTYLNLIELARKEVTDELSQEQPSDLASQMVDVRTTYIRVDFNGDGRSELRRVVIGGDQILANYECAEQSYACCSPIRMPHRHVGISYFDLLYDLQVIKTILFRQGIDNTFIQNNERTAVNQNTVNISDLLVSRPGSIVRVNGSPAEHLMRMPTNGQVMEQVIPALEYVDSMREMRTGIGRDTMGLDAEILQDVTKGGQLAGMAAAGMKVELVVRLLAEGVREIFLKMHRLLRRHQTKAMTVEIAGQWVEVNPSKWQERTEVTVNVGMGSGNREEQRANMMLMAQLQEKLGAVIATPMYQYAYETFRAMARLLGVDNPEKFAPEPNSPEHQKVIQAMQQMGAQGDPKANASIQVAKIKEQGLQDRMQGEQKLEQQRMQADEQRDATQAATERMRATAEMEHGEADRQNDLVLKLVQAFSTIIASQYKQQPGVNAGQVMADDVRTAAGAGLR